ncbi:MAG: glycosyltransferase [Verrucomicrobiota bacterium]
MTPSLSVIICTHNPREAILERTIHALRCQTFEVNQWEFLIIDNRSDSPIDSSWVDWHPYGRVIREDKLGLTQARLRGIEEALGAILVWCDDDNILQRNYLERARVLFRQEPSLGLLGGKALPEYEVDPPEWFDDQLAPLACRDLGEDPMRASWDEKAERKYPSCSPIGAGLVARRVVCQLWAESISHDNEGAGLGRSGTNLSSGEDNDLVMTALSNRWAVGYDPGLVLQHLIPASRLTESYLAQLAFASSRDWIRVLHRHQVCPWSSIPAWTVPFRETRAWFRRRVWAGPAEYIRWSGDCGHFEGRSMIRS